MEPQNHFGKFYITYLATISFFRAGARFVSTIAFFFRA